MVKDTRHLRRYTPGTAQAVIDNIREGMSIEQAAEAAGTSKMQFHRYRRSADLRYAGIYAQLEQAQQEGAAIREDRTQRKRRYEQIVEQLSPMLTDPSVDERARQAVQQAIDALPELLGYQPETRDDGSPD
jgi:AcrR family transcriptional regulator